MLRVIVILLLITSTSCAKKCHECKMVVKGKSEIVLAETRKICSEEEVEIMEKSSSEGAVWKCTK